MGTMIERINLLEKKYSKVSVLKADFNIMKMWIECQFGIIFPKGKDDSKHEHDNDDDNPFYELEVMRHRVAVLESKVASFESMKSQSSSHGHANFSSAVAHVLKKPATQVHRKYLPPTPVVRAKPKPVKKITKPVRKIMPPPKLTPIVNRQQTVQRSSVGLSSNRPPPTLTEIVKIMEDAKATVTERFENNKKMEEERLKEATPEFDNGIENKEDEFSSPMEVDDIVVQERNFSSDNMQEDDELYPPKLDNFSMNNSDSSQQSPSEEKSSLYNMSATMNSSHDTSQHVLPAVAQSLETTPEKAVTYTTRGRRHVVPRRYAEYTPHTNVTAILKKQKVSPAPKRVVKVPEKIKYVEPFIPSPGGPACVRALVERVENLIPDDNGMVMLSERFPHVITEQQKLLIIIQKSGGKATRLTRKITTLIFEDAVLASASPFGTKYYKDRLDPDRLQAIVDFIISSDFEQNFDDKKIYNIVAQVCNEARAGRVKKIAIKAEPTE